MVRSIDVDFSLKKWFVSSGEDALRVRKKWSVPRIFSGVTGPAAEVSGIERFSERKKWSRSRRISLSPSPLKPFDIPPPPMALASSTERLTTLWSGIG